MLYPRQDRERETLLYACRNCEYQEGSENSLVYRNDIDPPDSEQTQIISDLAADPTLPRTEKLCPQCGHDVAVFFESHSRRADAKMTLYYVCADTTCGYRWTDSPEHAQNTQSQNDGEDSLDF
ncbi:376_t:CDS:2 [Paraglomus occultum]|uniref:DNA-directed RNA polymerase subunit n=1 Tax=Paraglomus occultum TaxID=144539 RepID=A0A9N8ZZ04_9GLOM|nr:376_t:CDS:2 [Paraglomus occultum]